MQQPAVKRQAAPILLFFFASGFSALLYQTVWLKYLTLLFGSTTFATAAILSAYMLGLTLGSWMSARFAFLFRASLRNYGALEIAVGIFALSFPVLYSHFPSVSAVIFNVFGPETFSYNALTFLTALLVLVVPTSLMGATLPVLSHYLVDRERVSSGAGFLYGINTVGAVAGILISAFVLIPLYGLTATLYLGALINLTVGLACFILGIRQLKAAAEPPAIDHLQPGTVPSILYVYAVSGLLAIGYEVIWTRLLVLHLGSSVYAYAIMLSVFLAGISLGSVASGKWIDRTGHEKAETLFVFVQAAWGVVILLQIVQFAYFSDLLYWLARGLGVSGSFRHFLVLMLGVLSILLAPTFLSGALFPAVVAACSSRGMDIKNAVSRSYSVNTFGGIFGSLLLAFVCIPLLGTQRSLLLLGAFNLVLALAAAWASNNRKARRAVAVLLVAFVVAAYGLDRGVKILRTAGIFRMEGKEKLIHLEEDHSAAVSVEQRVQYNRPYDSLSINGVNVAGTSADLISVQKLQGHIPLSLFGPEKPKSVLHIGFGSGGTAYSVSLYPRTKITVVELSRSVVRNAARYFQSVNHGIAESGKLKFIYFDGRSYLQNTREKYDVILSDSIHPRYSGNGSLYTLDYYRLVYDRLNSGGVHSQWIPIYSVTFKNLKEILKAFAQVFPESYVWYINSTVNPYIVVTGRKDCAPGMRVDAMRQAFAIQAVRLDLLKIGVLNEYYLLDYFLIGPDKLQSFLADTDPQTDDRVTVEYESSRVLSRDESWRNNFARLLSARVPASGYLSGPGLPDPAICSRFYSATSYNLQGQLFFLLHRNADAKRNFTEAWKLNPSDHDPYEFQLLF